MDWTGDHGDHYNAEEHQGYWISSKASDVGSLDHQDVGAWDQRWRNGWKYITKCAVANAVSEEQRMAEMGELGNAHTQCVPNRLVGTLGQVRRILVIGRGAAADLKQLALYLELDMDSPGLLHPTYLDPTHEDALVRLLQRPSEHH